MWLVGPNPQAETIETTAERPELSKLARHGVLLVRELFTPAEITNIRARVETVIERAFRESCDAPVNARHPSERSIPGDLLSMRELGELDHVLLDHRVVGCAKRLLGEDVAYFGDSGVRVGTGGRGFHKDFVDHTPPTAGALRFVLYLQDHARHGEGLKVRLGSHRRRSRHFGRMMNIPTEPGDLVIFYLRSSHTGHNVRLRARPGLCLHPKLENLVPERLRVPAAQRRICLLWTFGRPGPHLDRYLGYIARDPSPWKRCAYDSELVRFAAQHGVRLLKAAPEHGELVPPFPQR